MSNNFDWAKIDWNDVYPRALLIAAGKLQRLSWRGQPFGAIPGGKTAKDIVQSAIVKTISGERTWDGKKSLLEHLAGVISSEISHMVRSAENRKTIREDENVHLIADYRDNPETLAIRREQEQQFLCFLENKKSGLRFLAELILYDPDADNSLLINRLNLSSRELESLKRALRRATGDFLKTEPTTINQDGHLRSSRHSIK